MKQFCCVLAVLALFSGSISASGYSTEKVKGVGIGVDWQSAGVNPLPALGLLYANFGIISYQARATASYRSSDSSTFLRGGVGLGFTVLLLNFDLTAQTGPQASAGMYWGLSAFASGASLTPEIFAGYQINFSGNAENYLVAGLKVYLNFVEINR